MGTLITIILIVVAFLAGVLVGRANPKKADLLAGYANKAKDAIKKG